MAGGNKKKKTKPAANPARGFATTSLPKASKAIVDSVREGESTNPSGTATPETVPTSTGSDVSKLETAPTEKQRELHELSPDELEAQLEESELQQFVEQHAAKVRKESARQSARLETDKRVLRGQAEYLATRDWLPEELMQQVLDLTLAESALEQIQARKLISLVGDDLLAKVWTLRSCLLALEIPEQRIDEVLRWLVSDPPSQESAGLIWGLAEGLDWLSVRCNEGELLDYDQERRKTVVKTPSDDPKMEDGATQPDRPPSKKQDSPLSKSESASVTEDGDQDQSVSDVESDIEPDELLSTYLRAKAKLFDLNQALVEGTAKKKKTLRKADPGAPTARTSGERKLLQKLHKIESDVLFDQREADAQWSTQKVDLAREMAERKRFQLAHESGGANKSSVEKANSARNGVADEAERLGQEILRDADDLEDADLLGGMFNALPGIDQAPPIPSDGGASQPADVAVRDFGRITGMNPKRILEEACKSRDSGVKLQYKLISPTTYASRHSLAINWSKDQEPIQAYFLDSVEVKKKTRMTVIDSIRDATPDTAQSEAFVATVGLFLLFSGSPKEEKAHLKLPPAFRDLWDELLRMKQDHIRTEDCESVKQLRSLVEQSMRKPEEEEDEDEVIFKVGSRHRSAAASGVSTPLPQAEFKVTHQTEASQELRELWARKIATPSYQRMLLARMNLPMFHFKTAALEAIVRNRVTILVSETGSGKSTQLPAFILEHELSQGRHCKIYCTEPRRISAISLAQRVSEEMGEHKGDVGTARSLVGYAVRLESHTTLSTRLVYATTGIVLRMLENADGLRDITHLVIDEVHERSIDTDFLLIILRSLMQRRPDLRVILMSATVDARKFSEYLDGAPVVAVPGRTFPVTPRFLEDAIELTGHTQEDSVPGDEDDEYAAADDAGKMGTKVQLVGYSKKTLKTLANYDEYRIDFSLILKILEKLASDSNYQPFAKAVLVFLPGIQEIRHLNDMLGGHPVFRNGWRVHPLHSSFSSEDQQAAFEIPPLGTRKIVLATNIAETGITIPDVTCVIDTGKHKEMRFDEKRQMSRLILSFIAKANAKQRRGRAGRVQEGICFHLFTKSRHDELMAESQTPEMLRLSLQDLVMRVKICKLGDIEDALSQALDPPSSRNIRRAIDALIEVDALTSAEELTPLGQQLAKLPLDAQLGKLVLLGSLFGCLDFALTAAATLTSKTPFLSPLHAKKQADTVRLGFKRGDSDLLTIYNAYCTWRKVCGTSGMSEYQFCNKNFLSSQNLANIEDLKAQLLTSLVDAGFVQLGTDERTALSRVRPGSRQRNFVALPERYCSADGDDTVVSSVVAWSFYPKIIKQDGKGWRNIANNQTLALHPASVNKSSLSSDVRLLSFYSIMQSNSRFTNAQETTVAHEVALVLLAGDAVFHMYAGVIVLDGNRLRFKVTNWRTMIVLKALRRKLKEVLSRLYRSPGKELVGKQKLWFEVLGRMLAKEQRKA